MSLLDLFRRKPQTTPTQTRCSAGRGTPPQAYVTAQPKPKKRRR